MSKRIMVAALVPLCTALECVCDIFARGHTPCVAAHSVTRALFGAYTGDLYSVRRASDNATTPVGVLVAGGVADAAAQDSFCAKTECMVNAIFDQSPFGNHLSVAPARSGMHDLEVDAAREPLTLGGHKVYALYFDEVPAGLPKQVGVGYRNDATSGVATGDEPETMYMVTSGTHFNDKCCFDYGNAETHVGDDGAGTMEAISWTNGTWGMSHHGAGRGPWVMADLENGLFGSDLANGSQSREPSILNATFVTAMIKGDSGDHWAVKGGDATRADGLRTLFDGRRPYAPQYNPMKKQGAIILGTGGDNSHRAVGTFYEGCVTAGYSSDATDQAVQANIAEAGYGR